MRFGDGSTSTRPNVSHTYDAPGSYSVQLRVINFSYGKTGSESMMVSATMQKVGESNLLAIGLIVLVMVGILGIGLWLNKRRSNS